MKLEDILEGLDKAASETPAKTENKTAISKELDAVMTKEAAAKDANEAFVEGEKLAQAILEKLANDAITSATETTTEAAATTEATGTEVETTTTVEVEKKADTAETKVEAKVESAVENNTETKEENMDKSANELATTIANAILEKLAAVENTGTAGPNQIQAETAKMVAQHDQRVQPTPNRNGTLNMIVDGIVAKAKGMGAIGADQMAAGGSHSGAEAKDPAMGTEALPLSPDVQEKQAAVEALCGAGLEWEVAVDLVKSAAEEIAAEEYSQIKVAAVNQLVEGGMDFDAAVAAFDAAVQEDAAPVGKQ